MARNISTALVALALLFLAVPSDAGAQARLGVHGGLNFEGSDILLGGSAQFGIAVGEKNMLGQLGVEIYPFIKNVFRSRINVNGLFPLLASGGAEIYGGGGLMVQLERYEDAAVGRDDKDTDFGLNLVAGLVLSGADRNFRPFVEINQTIGGGTDFAMRGGIFFKLVK